MIAAFLSHALVALATGVIAHLMTRATSPATPVASPSAAAPSLGGIVTGKVTGQVESMAHDFIDRMIEAGLAKFLNAAPVPAVAKS